MRQYIITLNLQKHAFVQILYQLCFLAMSTLILSNCTKVSQSTLDGQHIHSLEVSQDLQNQDDEQEIKVIQSYKHEIFQPDPLPKVGINNGFYYAFASAVASNGSLSSEILLESSLLNIEAHKQSLLPQIIPSSSVDQDGVPRVELNINQTIFDNGRYRAGKQSLEADHDAAVAEHEITINDKIFNALRAYLRHNQSKRLNKISVDASKFFVRLRKKADSRLDGGIGNRSEQNQFSLKFLETKTEADEAFAESIIAEAEYKSLTGGRAFKQKPQRFDLSSDDFTPLSVLQAEAELNQALGLLEVENAEMLPTLSIAGNSVLYSGDDNEDQGSDTDLRLQFSLTQPIYWGKNNRLEARKTEVLAAETKVIEENKKAKIRLTELRSQIHELEVRLPDSRKLIRSAEKRSNGFEEQFLAGQASLPEIIGMIDTVKRAKRSAVEMEYAILFAELEIANILGLLVPPEFRR